MDINAYNPVTLQVNQINQQLTQATNLLQQLTKLPEDSVLGGIDPKLLEFIIALILEQKETKSTNSADKLNSPSSSGPASSKRPGAFAGPSGFLWKPSSDSDGKLVVLAPPKFSGQIASAKIYGPDGSIIEQGKPRGIGNGGREHFRFTKSGASFPPGCIVEFTLKNGKKERITIEKPGVRTEGR